MRPMTKHSVMIDGRASSISLERPFYAELKRIARRRRVNAKALVAEIACQRPPGATNLSSAVRLYVLADLQARVKGTENSHG